MKINPENALIVWNDADDLKVTELLVCDIEKQPAAARKMRASAGASDGDWLAKDNPLENPMGQFLWLAAAYRFASDDVMVAALKEFAKIDGQDWATEMLRRLGKNA